MALIRFVFCLVLGLLPAAASALALQLPSTARQTAERISPLDSYDLPLSGFADGVIRTDRAEGRVERRTWRIDGGSATTLQLLAPLRDQMQAQGFEPVFECQSDTCGGFDFRFGIEVVPAPDMHVDIQDYRFVAARHGDGRVASLLVSRSRSSAFVQAISVVPQGAASIPQTDTQADPPVESGSEADAKPDTGGGPVAVTPDPEARDSTPTDFASRLRADGHIVLTDLAFAPGGSSLEERAYASLRDLSAFLQSNPDLRVVLVGHTDSVGDLAGNIRLSKKRAQSVRTRLIGSYNVAPDRLGAEGNGYLAPVASNLTPEGRRANRRVEAILMPR